jgi:hypothetical protein
MSALREMQTAPEALPTVLTSLPPLLARRVFLAVPADARGRACCVCRAWRDALVDAWFWTRVDLTPEGGVAGRRADDKEKAMLLAAVGRARWQLEALCVSHISDLPTLLEVLRDNALSLRELSVGSSYHDPPTLEALVAAAPQLRTLNAWTRCSVTEAPRLLRAESPLKCLTLHNIWLEYGFHDLKDAEAAAPDGVGRRLFDALGDPLVQPSLLRIDMRHLGSWQPITTTALVDSLRARRLRVLQFDSCAPFPAELLARMIVGGALTGAAYQRPSLSPCALCVLEGAAIRSPPCDIGCSRIAGHHDAHHSRVLPHKPCHQRRRGCNDSVERPCRTQYLALTYSQRSADGSGAG